MDIYGQNPFSILKKRRGGEWSAGGSIVHHKGSLKATNKMIDILEDTCCLYLCLDTFHKTRFLCPFHQDYVCFPFPLNLCMSFSFSNISMLTKSYDKWLENDDKRRDVDDNMLEMPKKKKNP